MSVVRGNLSSTSVKSFASTLMTLVGYATGGSGSGSGATIAQVNSAIASAIAALKVSPAFTGAPTSPTASVWTNSTQIATTEYVDRAAKVVALSASRALSDADTGLILVWSGSSALTLTVPTGLNAGFNVTVIQAYGAGPVTITGLTTVKLNGATAGSVVTLGKCSSVTLSADAADSYSTTYSSDVTDINPMFGANYKILIPLADSVVDSSTAKVAPVTTTTLQFQSVQGNVTQTIQFNAGGQPVQITKVTPAGTFYQQFQYNAGSQLIVVQPWSKTAYQ